MSGPGAKSCLCGMDRVFSLKNATAYDGSSGAVTPEGSSCESPGGPADVNDEEDDDEEGDDDSPEGSSSVAVAALAGAASASFITSPSAFFVR